MIATKNLKTLSITLPLAIFVLIALFFNADIIINFESWIYLQSVKWATPFITQCVKIITRLGDFHIVKLLCLALFVVPNWRRNYAVPTSISVIISTTLNPLLKSYFARPRPDVLGFISKGGYGFPSGHSMASMALYGAFALLVWKNTKSRKVKAIATVLCAVIVVAVGFSRVYLGAHYVTDVIAGWCLSLSIVLCVNYIHGKVKREFNC